MIHLPFCDWCAAPLPERDLHHAGRPRRWCSNRCRKAAFRARRLEFELARALDYELAPLPPLPGPDAQIALAIADLRGGAGALARVAPHAQRSLGWRCDAAATQITRCIDDLFPGV